MSTLSGTVMTGWSGSFQEPNAVRTGWPGGPREVRGVRSAPRVRAASGAVVTGWRDPVKEPNAVRSGFVEDQGLMDWSPVMKDDLRFIAACGALVVSAWAVARFLPHLSAKGER